MNKTIFASFYSRQEAENAINSLKNDILSDDNPIIIRDNNQNNVQNTAQNNQQNNAQTAQEGYQQNIRQTGQTQPLYQAAQDGNPNCSLPPMSYFNVSNNFNGYAQQNLYNGYSSGSTIGGLFGLATSAISMATIGAPYILTTTLANMFSYPQNQYQMAWSNPSAYPMTTYPNNTGCTTNSDQAPQPKNKGVSVTVNVPEEKVWDIANSLKASNAVDVRST